jgi:hypothetical protein
MKKWLGSLFMGWACAVGAQEIPTLYLGGAVDVELPYCHVGGVKVPFDLPPGVVMFHFDAWAKDQLPGAVNQNLPEGQRGWVGGALWVGVLDEAGKETATGELTREFLRVETKGKGTLNLYSNGCADKRDVAVHVTVTPGETANGMTAGKLTTTVKRPDGSVFAGAAVTLWGSQGEWFASGETDSAGKWVVTVPSGSYRLSATSPGGATVFYPSAPLIDSSLIGIKTGSYSRTLVLANDPPELTGFSGLVVSGQTLQLYGRGFGSVKGKVDFNGYATSAVSQWSDTQIMLIVPSSAIPGCVRVFSLAGGYSECALIAATGS